MTPKIYAVMLRANGLNNLNMFETFPPILIFQADMTVNIQTCKPHISVENLNTLCISFTINELDEALR